MIHRIDVEPAAAASDPLGESVRHQIEAIGADVGTVRTARIYLIDADAPADRIDQAAARLLADPIVERAHRVSPGEQDNTGSRIEVHLKPGVMDPVAGSTEMALRDLGVEVRQVRTGRVFRFARTLEPADLRRIAGRVLANGVIESIHLDAVVPDSLPTGHDTAFQLRHVKLLALTDAELKTLSRSGHLFLSLPEMQAVQRYFRDQNREPTDIELETIAQTWSEHCVHKTLKSAVEVEERDPHGTTTTRRYGNLIRDTIFASTQQLMSRQTPPFCLSVFKDNAGVIAFDETDAVCMKVETHNHPSAIEPYGGSATGIGGCIRDVLGTGLSARPIANTDVFCVAFPETAVSDLPRGVIHPKRTLQQIVAGVRDYGNRMGIPTVNGAVYFDQRYVGNPLVFCGCVGLIPRDKLHKAAQPGDAIVVMGGRTGRDGIHGATFSSAELTDTHAEEFSHAVQIGNAITQKQMADVLLAARDQGLCTAVTDCGAGGLSSAIGEMGESVGATVDLDRVPLKYAGLRYDEIWISEAQERMVLAVAADRVETLLELAASENVEATVIGTFGTANAELHLRYRGESVGRLSMAFLHDGLPKTARRAVIKKSPTPTDPGNAPGDTNGFAQSLLQKLADPNIASKHWVIRQYDHEVQGGSVIKPLVGPMQIGPSDAAVVRPKLSSTRGVALSVGMAPAIEDPYAMAVASIDEAIRNAVSVGADPAKLALLDNFCWPSVDDEQTMGTLVRACEACHDAALAFGTPFISGKDSLHNQFTDSETQKVTRIPRTLLISAIAVLDDVRKCITMDFKQPEAPILLIAANNPHDLQSLAATHRLVAALIAEGAVAACHDVNDGGLAVALAEMCIASGFGATLDPDLLQTRDPFAESPGRYIIELRLDPQNVGRTENLRTELPARFKSAADVVDLGRVQRTDRLLLFNRRMGEGAQRVTEQATVEQMTAAWRGTLDW